MTILKPREVERLYDKQASSYDASLALFRLFGFERWRDRLVERLSIPKNSVVVDLCCGTGAMLSRLAAAVGPAGQVVGIDVSQGMLDRARDRVRRAGLANVTLHQADVETVKLPLGTSTVVSTFGLEMVPEYRRIVNNIAAHFPEGGRLGLLGLKKPETWPRWLIDLGLAITARYGTSRAYEDLRPWEAARSSMQIACFEEMLAGAAYLCVAQKGDRR